jgi:NAD+ kinase
LAQAAPVKLSKVLILHKKSTFQIQALEHRESRFLKLLEEHSEVVTRVKVAHEEHVETLEHLEKELRRRQVQYRSIARAELDYRVQDVDLMIAVGGDGTFLDASHSLDTVPMLGINSSSSSSFGHFCLASEKTIENVLDQIEAGELEPRRVLRLELTLNGSILPELVLNEVLIAHSNPAATCRYFLDINGVKEEQRSSGVWVGTPAGSTGSMRSAGGTVLNILDRRFEYIVREACVRPGERISHKRALMGANDQIECVSQMRTGMLFIDGQHIDYQFALGDELLVRVSPHDLLAYVREDVNDRFVEN